ncbi:hypothetical protein LBMAG43_14250 [Methylococcaceae bacterium]|nr:hypothetical protein LBMAG43_14250 [Methylococcaceae bacterium]
MIKEKLLSSLAIIVIFEEWIWDSLTLAGQLLSRLLHLEKFDNWLLNASPKMALFTFFIPLIIVTPFNILALFLLTHGAIIEGILLEIVVKLVGTLLIARIFRLVKTALLTFGWFAKIYHTISGILRWAHNVIQHTAIYQRSLVIKAAIKVKIATLLKAYSFSN